MIDTYSKRVILMLCIVLGCSWAAGAQTVTVDGDVTADSFTGDGANLTGVPADVFHGGLEAACPAGQTCSIIAGCPADFEVSGGGFFISSVDGAARKLVTLHQSYRGTVTQWFSEATNGSTGSLNFWSTVECLRVPAGAPPGIAGASPGLDLSRIMLVCPEWDIARYVDLQDADAAHYCPNHGLALNRSGGGPSPIPLVPE